MVDGKRQYASAKTMKLLIPKVNKIKNTNAPLSEMTVESYFTNWLENYVKPLKKAATYNQYETLYRVHISQNIGNKKVTEITQSDIQDLIAVANSKGLSTSTMQHIRKILHIGFEKMIDIDKIIEINPVRKIEIPRKQAKERKALRIEELAKLFETMKDSRWLISVKYALVTALRVGELVVLEKLDHEPENNRTRISKSYGGDTKSAKTHFAPLSVMAMQLLKEQEEMLFQEGNINKTLCFPSQDGKIMNPAAYTHLIAKYAKRAGIKASPHSLRHTFVFMNRNTMSLKELQEALGHSSSTQTLDIYGNMLSEDMKNTSNIVDDNFRKMQEQIDLFQNKESAKILQFKK
jgi:integrase